MLDNRTIRLGDADGDVDDDNVDNVITVTVTLDTTTAVSLSSDKTSSRIPIVVRIARKKSASCS